MPARCQPLKDLLYSLGREVSETSVYLEKPATELTK